MKAAYWRRSMKLSEDVSNPHWARVKFIMRFNGAIISFAEATCVGITALSISTSALFQKRYTSFGW